MKIRPLLIAVTFIGTFIISWPEQVMAAEKLQDPSWNRHQGFYAELNAGTNLYYFGMLSSEGSASNGGIHGFAWNAAGGYSFSGSNALEVGFMQNYAKYEDEDESTDVNTHTNITYLAWRGSVPFGRRWAFFGKLGAMIFTIPDIEDREWLVLPYTGIGLRYALTPHIDISVQYQGAVYILVGAGAFTGGITYNF